MCAARAALPQHRGGNKESSKLFQVPVSGDHVHGERETERERENTLLHRDKDLSTSRHFCKSVPNDKHSNTQYIRQEYS